ncbi:MAG: glycoside hydrolase N-terminal domain-containing protein [Bacteroidaceae bacterium]|nr:glycoside hydrolase N-terminal domain-containing protein [Bacteroidaceae bacterium]
MKKLFIFIFVAIASLGVGAQGTMPAFTTAGQDTSWFFIQFTRGGNVLNDPGTNGAKLVTAAKSAADGNKWALIGTKDNFRLVSKLGGKVIYSDSRFCSSKTAEGATFRLINGSGCWELQRTNSSNCMNQWGGASVGVQLGEWGAGDVNNGLNFVVAEAQMPKFSAEEDFWYFIEFAANNNTILDQGAGSNTILTKADPVDGQLWKLVGSKDSFQLVSKLGNYAVITGSDNSARLSTSSSTPYSYGFALKETTNTSYAPAWEISARGVSSGKDRFNQWQGAEVGHAVGLWTAGDVNDPLQFVSPDNMVYDDYKVSGATGFTPEHSLTLWYTQPATLSGVANKWMEYSLPIGNGQLGASLFGGVATDEVQFNEKTLWTGTPTDLGSYGQYKNFGSLFVRNMSADFDYSTARSVKDYVRWLDIEDGVSGVDFKSTGSETTYERRYFSSMESKVVAAHYTAEGDADLDLLVYAKPGDGISASTPSYSESMGSFGGKLATVTYNATFRVIGGEGAVIEATGDGVRVSGTKEVTVLLAALTDYDDTDASCKGAYADVAAEAQSRLDAAESKGWNTLLSEHQTAFRSYMGRVSLQLGAAASSLPTNELIDRYNSAANSTGREPETLFLEQLYFAYGRYLEISSSLGVNVPSNLQGIWNNLSQAPWNSDIHSNINVQMNYWPAEPTNLSETHLPFLNYIINMAGRSNWKRAATTYGNVSNGWTCFTENNIFGGMSTWGNNYFVANVWYCSHLWQHYLYTLDRAFLLRAFPAMYSAAQFWMERMINDRGYSSLGIAADGTYVAPNEYSPEQDAHNSEDGTAHAQQLIYSNFKAVREAIDILGGESGVTEQEIARLDTYIEKTDQGLHTETYTANTAKNGQWTNPRNGVKKGDTILREWKYSAYDVSDDPGHRHLSHLMALYPLNTISSGSPYFEPAVNSLKLRGDAATGWSMGWKVNLWARALDGDHAHIILKNALKHSTAYTTNQYAGGIYYNLYDSHAPFQIDGNFGVCAGIAEMLMQSHAGCISVLPALPAVWSSGKVSGLKAVGDFEVGIEWSNGKPDIVTVKSNQGSPLYLSYPEVYDRQVSVDGVELDCQPDDHNTLLIPLEAGQTATIDFNNQATKISSRESRAKGQEVDVQFTTVNRQSSVVKVTGSVARIVVTDTLGNQLLQTDKASFCLDTAFPRVLLLRITTRDGQVVTKKIRI